MIKEFEDIPHSGGKITFHNGQHRYEMRNPYPLKIYELIFSLNGCLLGRSNLKDSAQDPSPSVALMIMSDKEGFFGFSCPKCNKYFRSNLPYEETFCTYCLYFGNSLEFLTDNQKRNYSPPHCYVAALLTMRGRVNKNILKISQKTLDKVFHHSIQIRLSL